MALCPLCNDKKKAIKVVEHPYTKRPMTIIVWCLCMRSRYISECFDVLGWLGDAYLPLCEIDSRMNLTEKKNLFILSSDYKTFCLHVKSVLIKYLFIKDPPNIYLCKGFNILKRFFVKQSDGTSPSLSDLNRYDLIIFTLDTLEKNDHLGTCISQVVYNRICMHRPTWIYLPTGSSLENTREYTPELKGYLESDNFQTINLITKDMEIKATKTNSQSKAEGFRPAL